MSRQNDYNNIAFCYDGLSRIVFGKHIKQSQICLLSFIGPGSKILIVGGGSGWILEEISRKYSSGLHIVYVEASANMIKLAKAKKTAYNTVELVNEYIEVYQPSSTFDVIITAFLFDNFDEETTTKIFNKLHILLNKNGKWLFADFIITNRTKYQHKLLIRAMYFFFKITSNVQAKKLTDTEPIFIKNGYKKKFCQYHYHQVIKSICWIN